MRAVIYCRVSTKEQTLNLSLPTQMTACREYCRRHGYSIAREFVEEGESAKTADRTKLQELLTYCRQNKNHVQALVVYNVTRFARDRFDHVVLRAHPSSLRRWTTVLAVVPHDTSQPDLRRQNRSPDLGHQPSWRF